MTSSSLAQGGGGAQVSSVLDGAGRVALDNERISGRLSGWEGRYLAAGRVAVMEHTRGYVRFLPGGMQVRQARLGGGEVTGGGGRGVVNGLSADSRRRLINRLMAVDFQELGGKRGRQRARAVFVTLTYPGDWDSAASAFWEVWKSHLKAFRKRLVRWLGARGVQLVGALWKLEFQQRGAPHFHLLVVTDVDVHVRSLRLGLLRAWSGIVARKAGQAFDYHGRRGVDVVAVYGGGGKLMRYCAKYLAKAGEVPEVIRERGTGRVWGVWGELPARVYAVVSIHSTADWWQFIMSVRSGLGAHSPYLRNFWEGRVYGDGADFLLLLRGLLVRVVEVEGESRCWIREGDGWCDVWDMERLGV